jgi:hypothetical protein
MATVVNDRDVLIMGATTRYNPPTDRGMFLTPSASIFKVSSDGLTASPSSFTFTATLLNMTGTVTWSYSGGIALSISGNTATLSFASFSAVSGTITASITVDGQIYTQTVTVSKVADGSTGQQGSRGNVDIAAVTSGSVWSDSEAVAALAAAGYGSPQVRDMVTLYKSDRTFGTQKMYNGSAWVTVDYVWNGNVFVKGSILPEAIDTRGLTVKDAQGNIILGAGTGLPAAYFAGIVGGDNLCPNSSFEVVSNGTLADGWAIYNNNSVDEPASASLWAGRTGGNAQAISWSNSHSYTKGITRSGAVPNGWVVGATYVVSFYAKTTNISGGTTMSLQWNTNPGTLTELMNPGVTTAWQRYAFKITWGASVESSGRIYISVSSGPSGGNIIIDDVMIVEGDVLPAYYPSTTEAKAAADAANAAIVNINSDGVLSKGEKLDVVQRWNTCDNERASLDTQSDALGVSRTNYDAAHSALSTYLISLNPGWSDTTQDTAIDPTTWKAKWNAYYDEKQKLINALAAKSATLSTWGGVTGTGKPADNATVGATFGTNVGGQITPANASTYIASAAIQSAMVSDLRTSNYSEDGSGNPTAGAKLASAGTALKVANSSLQVGSVVFSDYWFRLVQGIDGSVAGGRVIWRGNNDSTTRGGAPNIGCLSITPVASQVLNSNFQQIYHNFAITPTSYSTYTDNLDAMQQIHVQLFASTTATSPFVQFYWGCPSRTYDGASGIAQGSWSYGWRFAGSGALPGVSQQYETNGVFTGLMRVRYSNTYGWSATQDFAAGSANGTALTTTTITGTSGSSGGGSGGTSGGGGGACPAPWVKVRLANGCDVNASELHNGARVMAVDDNTMLPLPQGGIVRDVATIWKLRYRIKLTNGAATEWSENHRFAVVDRGWTAVQNLRSGDHIMGLDECVVDSVFAVGEGQVVSYRVEGAGTYFAGGMLCHNLKMLP